MASVLVTGASTGIGRACALRLDRLGHLVFAGVRKGADAEALRAQASGRLVPVMLDVTDAALVDDLAAAVQAAVGDRGLGGLVNNAGIGIPGPVELLGLDRWRHQLEVNVIGQVAVTKALLPALRDARGRIVFMGSVFGRLAPPLVAPYAASKFAIEAIASSLAEELRPWGIRVVVVEPGVIATDIWDKGRARTDALEASMTPEARSMYRGQLDRARALAEEARSSGIDPERVAEAVQDALFSARPRRRYQVGADARAGALAARLLPDRALGPVLRRLRP